MGKKILALISLALLFGGCVKKNTTTEHSSHIEKVIHVKYIDGFGIQEKTIISTDNGTYIILAFVSVPKNITLIKDNHYALLLRGKREFIGVDVFIEINGYKYKIPLTN